MPLRVQEIRIDLQAVEYACTEMNSIWEEHTVALAKIVHLLTSVGRENLVMRGGVKESFHPKSSKPFWRTVSPFNAHVVSNSPFAWNLTCA